MIFDYSPESMGMLGRLVFAAVLGGLIGLERDVHGRAAGLRTHMLVAIGSALYMIISILIATNGAVGQVSDPGRIAAQIVTGIGFLGAGTIIKEGFSVRGLTTAACFWVVAAIGMAAGAAYYTLAAATCLISLIALSILNRVDKLYKRDSYRTLTVRTSIDVPVRTVIDTLKHDNVSLLYVDSERDYETRTVTISFALRIFHKGTTDKISEKLIHSMELAGVPLKSVSWYHGKMY